MLSAIQQNIVSRLQATGYFDKIYPMVELVAKGDTVFPAQYCGQGQYTQVSNYDNYNGLAYIRMIGKERISSADDEFAMCDPVVQVEYPMRMVACVPKNKLSVDDAYADDRISKTLVIAITQKGGTIKQVLKAIDYSTLVDAIDFDNRRILSEEYQNIPKMQDINYRFSYHAIDFVVMVKTRLSCMAGECDFSLADIPNDYDTPCYFQSCADLKAYIDAKALIQFKKITLTSGAINGINTVFVWAQTPLFIMWQGQKLTKDAAVNGYTLSGTTSTGTEAPMTGDSYEAYGVY